jgi:hypothetical protein
MVSSRRWRVGRSLRPERVDFAVEALDEREHPGELDPFGSIRGVSFVALRALVGVVVPEQRFALDGSVVEGVVSATRVLRVVRPSDGDRLDPTAFCDGIVFDRLVARHPLMVV